jgi:hypothetical protein
MPLPVTPAVRRLNWRNMDERKYIQYVKDMAQMYKSEFGEDGRYQDVMAYIAVLEKRLTLPAPDK